jgi:UDP-3-O-[3-hydroxymyristoyl] glucosamine N-acyltransferase
VKIGENCMFAGQVGIVGHIKVGNRVTVASKSGLHNNVPDGISVLGFPSMEASKYKRSFIVFRHLPELSNNVDTLIKKVADLEQKS